MHRNFKDAVEKIADSSWGQEASNLDDLAQRLVNDPQKLTAWAIMYLIRTLRDAMLGTSRRDGEIAPLKADADTKTFPDTNIGDALWTGDLDEGFGRVIVVAKDDFGHCMVQWDEWEPNPCRPWIATDYCYSSLKEAVIASAKSHIEYHSPRLKWAQEAMKAKSESDLQGFVGGFSEDE